MFKDFQRILQQSVAAFRAELNKREPEDEVAELLSAMRRELVEARASLAELTRVREETAGELARERTQLEQCERRGQMAEQIGDRDTVRVAEEFAVRHRERIGVLEQKTAAVEAELALRSREADEMKRRFQAAEANRATLLAELRRAHSRDRIRSVADETSDAFSEFQRMEEKVQGSGAYVDALGELDDAPPSPGADADAAAVEERLREIKRRMGKE